MKSPHYNMTLDKMNIEYQFVPYGMVIEPEKDTLVMDVGMKTVPGVIDHHHPEAEVECTASLIVKSPSLVLDHIKRDEILKKEKDSYRLRIITHRLPDFDAVSSIFLALKLIEIGIVDPAMAQMADYTKMVDSASLPKNIDLASTPYSILRGLFRRIKKDEEEANQARIVEGLKFMRFLHTKVTEGYEILENRVLFSGIDRYERAMRHAEKDYFHYMSDFQRSLKVNLTLPLSEGKGKRQCDGLIVRNPRSYLLKEWARRDRENSSLKEGFTFLMTNFEDKRYILGVDPEGGVNLRGLGDLLSEKEAKKREEQRRSLTYQWYDGNCPFFNYRIVVSPQDDSSLTHEEIVDTILSFSQSLEKK